MDEVCGSPWKGRDNSPRTVYTKETSMCSPGVGFRTEGNYEPRAARAIVQEMIKKRREDRKKGLDMSKGKNCMQLELPLKESTLKTTVSVQELFKSTDDLSRDIGFVGNSNNIGTIKNCRNSKPPLYKKQCQTLSNKEHRVFDRLYETPHRKLPKDHTSNSRSTSTRFKKRRSANSVKVEDRLLDYKRKSEDKLAKKRAESVKKELSLCQKSPRILSTPLARTSSHGSLLDRFDALEKERQRRLMLKVEEKIVAELAHVQASPRINAASKRLKRGINKMLTWEEHRKQRQEVSRQKEKRKEMEQLIVNRSISKIAPGSKQYLAKMGRNISTERVEDKLIRYGKNSKAKARKEAETTRFTHRPNINNSAYKVGLYAPFSLYSQVVNTQELREHRTLSENRPAEANKRQCRTLKEMRETLKKSICRSIEDDLNGDPYEAYYPILGS
eukprot:TRINITY_DN7539_c0_g5_i2.p1 TRINITY_DN7539_c0_g5~~TRINITY_DN7539_c0_g5_i2.p1  ORF type:complete len:444 (-),score=90.68 TRINITY_DN7539_c0_g5_i2:107-1438(-)